MECKIGVFMKQQKQNSKSKGGGGDKTKEMYETKKKAWGMEGVKLEHL